MTVSMITVTITNLDSTVGTWKSKLPQGNLLRSLTQPGITRHTPFELTDIKYDQIKDKIIRMECVEYNTAIGRNVMNVDDIEDFANF